MLVCLSVRVFETETEKETEKERETNSSLTPGDPSTHTHTHTHTHTQKEIKREKAALFSCIHQPPYHEHNVVKNGIQQ